MSHMYQVGAAPVSINLSWSNSTHAYPGPFTAINRIDKCRVGVSQNPAKLAHLDKNNYDIFDS